MRRYHNQVGRGLKRKGRNVNETPVKRRLTKKRLMDKNCSDCHKEFSRKDVMLRHRRNKRGLKLTKQQNAPTYQQCGNKFSKKSLLLKHHRDLGHHESYDCEICRKKFGRKYNIDRHMVRHKDESLHP
jgi:uncharacterized Zn-finger protein